jgi:phage terminase large subunit-like protein
VQIEGPSGLLRRSPPWLTPKYVKMPRPKLTFPNGVTLLGFSGEDPESLRGFSGTAAAMDEWCAMRYPEETLDMLLMCLREGDDPQLLITTTPKPIPILRKLVKDPSVYVVTGNTWENSSNLPPQYLALLKDKYEGTILGRQELEAEILDDNPHAMFRRLDFDATRVVWDVRHQNVTEERARLIASMEEIVVAIDPSTKDKKSSDECGIIVAGRRGKEYYLIADESDVMKPREWAEKGVKLYRQYGASWIVIETNMGGDMVVDTIRTVDDTVPIKPIHATKSKSVRAQPISSLSQQHRIHHIGLFPKLEDELCVWEPGLGMPSPNRYDAYCYALLYLCGGAETWALSADLWDWIRTRGQASAM